MAPQWGSLVDRIVPWTAQVIGVSMSFTGMIIALSAAQKSIGAICVTIILFDMGQQCAQVASNYRIMGIDPKARARLNGCILFCIFLGQVRFWSSRQCKSFADTRKDIWDNDHDENL